MTVAASQYPLIGTQPISNYFTPDATQRHVLGSIVGADDPYFGGGEFIYLQANATITTGQLVVWDGSYLATVAPTTANTGRGVAVAVGPGFSTGQFGWFQLTGQVPIKATASVAAGTTFGIDATTGGQVNANSAGRQVLNAVSVQPSTFSTTKVGSTVNGSTLLRVNNADGWFVGLTLSGTGIAGGATVAGISSDGRTITMSAAATATGSATITGTITGFIFAEIDRPFLQGAIT